uniref:SR-related CTD-associated factor 4b n=1 Tax=Nothobranchius korthausae TaxID=1143690 RepID=A0A1A8H7Z7_9TELE
MDAVNAFNMELFSMIDMKPPISRAKMMSVTKSAIKAIKLYKHVVQIVEKFIKKCKPELKVPGLYVVDSIVRQSRHQFGVDKDVFGPRFLKNFTETFQNLYHCPEDDKSKIARVLNLWQKNGVFDMDILQPLMDMEDVVISPPPALEVPVDFQPETAPPVNNATNTPTVPQLPSSDALAAVAQLLQSPHCQELQMMLQSFQQAEKTLAVTAATDNTSNPIPVNQFNLYAAETVKKASIAEKLLDRFEYDDDPEDILVSDGKIQTQVYPVNKLNQFPGQMLNTDINSDLMGQTGDMKHIRGQLGRKFIQEIREYTQKLRHEIQIWFQVPQKKEKIEVFISLKVVTATALSLQRTALELLSAVIDLLHVLWFTNLGQKEEKLDKDRASSTTQEKPQGLVKCLPLPLISEFLCVATAICRHLRLGVKATQFSLFVQTLCSVLVHRGTALSVNKQSDRLTLHPQPLSCTEALALLLCWASLSCNTALLAQIQALSEQYKVRELMGMGKNKVRGKGFISQSGTRRLNHLEDNKTLEEEENLLTDCKLPLSRIFLHWEPVFQPSEPQSVQPRDEPDPGQLANDTAHLLTKWSVRWLVEDTYDANRTKELLLWLEKVVVKPRRILKVVMQDFGLKADLLQLFHHSFEAQHLSSVSAGVETVQLFTNVMISLLETQENLPEFHRGVISTCLPEHDPSKREAGLFLLSSYIHELWSGASSAQLFLSHISLVTRTKSKGQKGSKTKSQTAIRAICNDIIAMTS